MAREADVDQIETIPRLKAAEMAGVVDATIDRWIREGLVRGYKVRRSVYVNAEDLARLLEPHPMGDTAA